LGGACSRKGGRLRWLKKAGQMRVDLRYPMLTLPKYVGTEKGKIAAKE